MTEDPDKAQVPKGADAEQRYEREELVAGARGLLGVSGPVVTGALAGSQAKMFTLKSAAKLVNDYRDRPEELSITPQSGDEEAAE